MGGGKTECELDKVQLLPQTLQTPGARFPRCL